jgi:hypothetical protein
LKRLALLLLAIYLVGCTNSAPPAVATPPEPAATAPLGTPAVRDVPLYPGLDWSGPKPLTEQFPVVDPPVRVWESAYRPDLRGPDVASFYRRALTAEGYLVGFEAGSDTNLGLVAAREGAGVLVNFWQGERPANPPVRPELGFKVRVVTGGETLQLWALLGIASLPPTSFGRLPGPAGAAPPPEGLFSAYRLTAMPPAPPAQAPVYKLRAPDFSPNSARSYAGALGFSGEPQRSGERTTITGTGAFVTYAWEQGEARLEVFPVANALRATDPPNRPLPLPEAPDAARDAANEFLRSHGLLPNDRGAEDARALVGGGEVIRFARVLEGRPVVGPRTSGIAIAHRPAAKPVWSFEGVHRPLEARSPYPLRPVAAAWAEIEAGRELAADGLPGDLGGSPELGAFTATEVALVYREAAADTLQPYLEPLYAFRGRAERAGDAEIVLFAPAVADAWRGGG